MKKKKEKKNLHTGDVSFKATIEMLKITIKFL